MRTPGDRVIIEPIIRTDVIPGLLIAESRGIAQKGKLLACGCDVKTAKVGDEVFYAKNAGYETTFEGKVVIVMRESDLFAMLP